MCGIFGYIGKRNNSADIVLNGLKILEYRGYDSWGVGVLDFKQGKETISIKKKAGRIGNADVSELPDSNLAFGHTRWATHGGVTDENAHPHLDCTKKIALVHNGIVENYENIKEELLAKGHIFHSQTDSEVIVHLIEELQQKYTFSESVRSAFKRLKGRNAIIAISASNPSIVVAKNGSPIVIGLGIKENFIASDASALISYTKKVIYLEDGQLAKISGDNIELSLIQAGRPVNNKEVILDWKPEEAQKAPYKHFLLKEIMEQGQTIASTVTQNKIDIMRFAMNIKKSFGSYFVGCGTAGHACREATYIFSTIAKRHINFCIGSEFAYFKDFLSKDSLLIAVSQSGETADLLDAVSAAKNKGSKIVSIINVEGSTLSRISDDYLPLRVGPEKSVLSTKAFTSKLALFYLLAYSVIDKYSYGLNKIIKTADLTQSFLQNKKNHINIKNIAEKIYKKENIYIIGRGLSYPIALESAHKIKEATYIHAEGFAGGEPKHCEISLISEGTPCIIIAPNDETNEAILSNAMEFKARGGYIIGISPRKESVFDEWIQVPDISVTSSLINIIPSQLLAYYLALKRKCDPDKPRNLAKSVTVK